MAEGAVHRVFLVDGMTCGRCEARIERAVGGLRGVRRVKATAGTGEVAIDYHPSVAVDRAIEAAIAEAGYRVRADSGNRRGLTAILGLAAILTGAWLALRFTGGAGFVPVVSQSMGYGLVFVVGLLTSLHCIGMCGGIALSQGAPRAGAGCVNGEAEASPSGAGPRTALSPSLLYNAGRVISYTAIGALVGGIGSVVGLSPAVKGILPVVAGALMAVLGIRMLGIFPWLSRLRVRLPGAVGRRLSAAAVRRGPFVVGLLNGLMPCGPLQTMQVYALGTGSIIGGALSMFLFSLGTVPLLLGLGAIGAFLGARFTRRLATASGALVAVLGLVMLGRGLTLSGVALPGVSADTPVRAAGLGGGGRAAVGAEPAVARLATGVQEVTTRMSSGRYRPIVVQQGVPVRWTITAAEDDLNGCNNPVTVPRLGITKELVAGTNVIEFTPDKAGTIVYTCWMGMISSTITVVPDLATYVASGGTGRSIPGLAAAFGGGGSLPGGCCAGP